MNVEVHVFRSRAERSEYVACRYRAILRGKVLDVGCDQAVLRRLRPEIEYTGVDMAGAPDIRLNLEMAARLPFPDDAFDCVVCTDVLEHLDNLHVVFGELVRVSRQHMVLSLPNCWAGARVPIQRGRGAFAHYGLPLDKPTDRHKCFFHWRRPCNSWRGRPNGLATRFVRCMPWRSRGRGSFACCGGSDSPIRRIT